MSLIEVLDTIHNSINGIERLVNETRYPENNYTFIKQREQATCHELILAATKETCLAFITVLRGFEQLTSIAKVTELYVRFFETEDTVVNDINGMGRDIKELLECTSATEKYKRQCTSEKQKLESLNTTITNIEAEFLLQRIRTGQNTSRKRQSLKQDAATSSTYSTNDNHHYLSTLSSPPVMYIDKTIKQGKDWTVYYNPDVEPVIDLLYQITTSYLNDLTYSTDGKLVAVATRDVAVVYNTETGAKECELKDTIAGGNVSSVCFDPNGYLIVGQGNSVGVWDISQQRHQYILDGHKDYIYALTYSSKKKYLFSGSRDDTVKIWNMKQQCCVHTLGEKIITGSVYSVALSPEEYLLAAGSYDRSITTWDINTGVFLSKYIEHTGWINSVAFSNDGKLVASGGNDKLLKLWDISSGKCIHTFTHHKDTVCSVTFTPSNWLASGSKDTRVIFYDLRAPLVPCALLQDSNSVKRLAFSPVEKTFATLSNIHIQVWKSW